MNRNLPKQSHYSTVEAAKLLHVSRITIFNRIKSGLIPAHKVGRNFVIGREDLEAALGHTITARQKDEIKRVVKKP
ncbi:MAG: excisionase family DNA-binding protein [Patescibacteria group bacterium]|nr:excisionase family DNA-binding protein [Patescibacteria group bacterium]